MEAPLRWPPLFIRSVGGNRLKSRRPAGMQTRWRVSPLQKIRRRWPAPPPTFPHVAPDDAAGRALRPAAAHLHRRASHELKTPLARGEERRLYALTSGYKVS